MAFIEEMRKLVDKIGREKIANRLGVSMPKMSEMLDGGEISIEEAGYMYNAVRSLSELCPECDAIWDTEHNRCSANCQAIEGDRI